MGSDFYQARILPHAGIIIKICRAYTNNREDFDDYYQEVCLQIWRSRDNFRQQCEWSTWIYRITLNVCLTYLKKDKANRDHFVSDAVTDATLADTQDFVDDDVNRLYGAIRQLSEIDRAVILLYLDGKSHKETAEITGTNANNIGVRIKRIKQRLNKLLCIEDES